MIIKVRTLQGLQKEVNVSSEETIKDLKNKVEEVLPEMESSKLKIIFGGRILEDTVPIAGTLRENDAVIVMISRRPAFKNAATVTTENKKTDDKATNHEATNATVTDETTANNAELNSHKEDKVSHRSGVLNDEEIDAKVRSCSNLDIAKMLVGGTEAISHNGASVAVDHVTGGHSQDNNTLTKADAGNIEWDSRYGLGNDATSHNPRDEVVTVNLVEGEAGISVLTDEEGRQLLENPNFIEFLRFMVTGTPQNISQILEAMENTDPDILRCVRSNPQRVINIMQQVITSNADHSFDLNDSEHSSAANDYEELEEQLSDIIEGQEFSGDMNDIYEDEEYIAGPLSSINLTENELESVHKLEALGFPQHVVLEAFIACDKDEELAANYLFENWDADDAA